MICLHCTRDNPAASRFCDDCGRALGRACAACGFANPAESLFCGGCGGRLAEVQPEDAAGERRQLTVLFCDIVGSTQLAQALDPEDFGRMLAEYQRICGEAAQAHAGHVSQYLGDGVVVYFGYPRAYEDEPQRAVRCALDIIAGVRDLRESGRFPAELSPAVRLGAHTGRVVVGPVGAGDRRDRLALGSTPSIAARIQSEAEPGSLVVSESTWRIVRGYFHGRPLGARTFKGLDEPVELWVVTGVSESSERVEVAATLTPFVGRWPERALLEEAWKETVAGTSRFVLLRGEPGVGKSRLAHLVRGDVAFTGARLLDMRTSSYGSGSPFHPVIELIERRLELDPGLDAEERRLRLADGLRRLGLRGAEAVGLLGPLLSVPARDGDPPLDLPPARRRYRTLELLVELVAGFARAGPALLLVEDLHWADVSTLEFLELLVATAPRVPLMAVLTARPEVRLNAGDALRTVDLARLDGSDIEVMVRGVALGKALPGELLGQIIARSEGVPLFIEEFTRAALDSGLLQERDVTWEAVDLHAEPMIPATVDASLTARVDRLGASRATAQLAATIGREFTSALLGEVSERADVTLAHDLEQLVQSGLVQRIEGEGGRYEFRHALIRDAAYNSLLRTTRQVHHRRIADALRRSPAHRAATRPDLIARHLSAAGEDAEAIAFWEAAGRQALARTAAHDAAAHFQAAIGCLGRLPATAETAERELELQILLAPLLMTVHGWGAVEVERACQRALALAQGLERHDRCYPPMWGLWTVRFLRGELLPATEAAEAVLGAACMSGVPMLEVTGRHALSYTLFSRGQYGRAVEEADAGLQLFDLAQERQLAGLFGLSSTVALRGSRGFSLWMLGRVVEAEGEWARMVALGRELGHAPSLAAALAFALYGEAFGCSYAGRMDRLAERVDELAELSRDDDFFLWYALAATFRAIVAHGQGEADARRQMLDGLELWERAGARLTLVMMNVFCAEALHRSGDDDEAVRRLEAAEAEAARGEGPMVPEIDRVRGRILTRRGDPVAAEASFRSALERARAQGAVPLELRAALDLADLLAGLGRAAEASAPLAAALGRCTEGLDRPEPTRAAATLASLPYAII